MGAVVSAGRAGDSLFTNEALLRGVLEGLEAREGNVSGTIVCNEDDRVGSDDVIGCSSSVEAAKGVVVSRSMTANFSLAIFPYRLQATPAFERID